MSYALKYKYIDIRFSLNEKSCCLKCSIEDRFPRYITKTMEGLCFTCLYYLERNDPGLLWVLRGFLI